MTFIRKWAEQLSTWGEWVGIVGVVIMVIVTCLDVLGAKLFLLPVPGATEIISLVQVATMVFAVAATQRHKGHISVAMFVSQMGPRLNAAVRAFTNGLGLILFTVLLYESILLGNEYLKAGEVTATVQIPFYPFAYLFALALVPMLMLLLDEFINAIKEAIL
jgi:TRAP-type C4-dicarboxylate transport system permease small subunit